MIYNQEIDEDFHIKILSIKKIENSFTNAEKH